MILQNINIQNLGSVNSFSCNFNNTLNLIKSRHTDVISYAVRLLTSHKLSPLPHGWAGEDTRITASILTNSRLYYLYVAPDKSLRSLKIKCSDEVGNDVTSEYLYMTSQSVEQDLSEIFEHRDKDIFLKCIQYVNEDLYYPSHELSLRTDGLSDFKTFRSYLRRFLKNFTPESIRDGKQYEIVLEQSGRYGVRCKSDENLPVSLSEAEQTLFRYLCFLRTAEFWRGFEQIRNIHGITRPLIVKDFIEHLDEYIDVGDIIKRTASLNRQVFLLTTSREINIGGE